MSKMDIELGVIGIEVELYVFVTLDNSTKQGCVQEKLVQLGY